ncbi:MAG: YqeG family HAD IIIA-type phosphatase [Clostridiales bacterium]|nr:YqeG family HAD IIIA-type phosphatase [Clostridiales bacterium]
MNYYIPDYITKNIFTLDYEKLIKSGIKGILIDIDNTLVPMHTIHPTKQSIEWVSRMHKLGFKVCILSNAKHERADLFKSELGVKGVGFAFKPSKKGYVKAMELIQLPVTACVMIGDQLLTDIKGGNKIKMMTILSEVLDKKEHWFVRLKRVIEKLVVGSSLEKVKRI